MNICLLVVVWLTVAETTDTSTLKFVHVLWRHGDRTPSYQVFPTDTRNTKDTWYNKGWGELTPIGMRQHFQLGKWLRQKYVETGFLNSTYFDQRQMYIRSTSYNRTIMSALANLAGMYPPTGIQVWNQNISWQPIPVHSIPKEEDPMLYFNLKCPHEEDVYKNHVLQMAEVKAIDAHWKYFYDFLANNTGWSCDNMDEVWRVMDPINCEVNHKDELIPPRPPKWVNKTVHDNVMHLYDISTIYYYYGLSVLRLRGGLLLGDVMDRMDLVRKGDPSKISPLLKYYVYSAHDTTVLGLLKTLGAYNQIAPPYAACVIIELHEEINGDWVVKASYQNETGETAMGAEAHPLSIKDCPTPCHLDTFINRGRKYVPDDWYSECGLTQPSTNRNWKVPFIVMVSVAAVLAILLVIVSYKYITANRNKGFGI